MFDQKSLPRIALGEWPTPLQEASRLSEELGIKLYIKREDLSGLGAGGNKARKLEYLLGQAQLEGATHIITTGAGQSNHAHLTAAAARKLGLQPHLVLSASADSPLTSGNLLLDSLLQADLTFYNPPVDGQSQGNINDAMIQVAQDIAEQGGKAYIIPEGGTNLLGTIGYSDALKELSEQLSERLEQSAVNLKRVLVVVAAGTCGTFSGLIAGTILHNFPFEIDVLGVSISGSTALKKKKTVRLVNEVLAWAGSSAIVTPDDIAIEDRFIGDGYAKMTKAGGDAIRLVAQTEGIFLDPVYTGKAAAAVIELARTGALADYDAVVFLHTGGLPLLLHYGEQL